MNYLIDGYNFLFRLPCHKRVSLEKRRQSLIDLLNRELDAFKGHFSIIFDSAETLRDAPQCARFENLDVIYAPRGQSADEYILELVLQSKNPKILTVITSDAGLARQCKQQGAQILSTEDFIAILIKKNRPRPTIKSQHKESNLEIKRLIIIFEKKLEN